MENVNALQAIERGEKQDQETLLRLKDEGLLDLASVSHRQFSGKEFIFVGFTTKGLRLLKESKLSLLSDVEKEITRAVVRTFLDQHRATSTRTLLRQFKSRITPALQRLGNTSVLQVANNTYLAETYLPKAIAFYHCGDSAALAFARKSTGIVLRVLRDLLDRDLEGEGNDQRQFTAAEVEDAARTIDSSVEPNMIFTGLYLAQEFSVFYLTQCDDQQVGIISFSLNERIYDTDSMDWDQHIRRSNTSLLYDWEKTKNALSDSEGSSPRSHDGQTSEEYKTAFDVYTVVRQVGSGGSGTVFLVTTSDGLNLALKLLDRSKTPRQKLKRFKNEIQFCLRPGSEHIVHVLDYGQKSDGSLFYVMPYYSNTLRDLIKKRLPHKELLPLYGQILDAVEAAHLLGVCHRDIKPENLLYDSGANRIVLADFGIARFWEEELLTTVNTGPNERLANFAYAAPEQRVPKQNVDQRADIYALGLILNEMFTGQIPQGTGFRQIKEVGAEFSYLDDLVEMMLQQRPEQRLPTVSRVKEELIGRGNEFIHLQRLEALKKQVVPDSEVNDPIISDPIRAVEKVDYRNGTLTLRLNKAATKKWEECFRMRPSAFSVNVSAAMMSFQADRVFIRVNDNFVPQAVEFFKQYCAAANEEYASRVKREHQQEIERRRADLKRHVLEEEARSKILQRVQL